jgi:hypothetical protein
LTINADIGAWLRDGGFTIRLELFYFAATGVNELLTAIANTPSTPVV